MQRFIFTLLLSLSAIQCGLAESNLRVASASHQRRELSWSGFWSNFMAHLGPHPPGHKNYSGGSSSSGSSSTSGGEDGDDADANDGDESNVVSSEVKAYYEGNDNGEDGSSIQYSDYDSSSSYSFVNGQGNGGASANSVNAKNSAGLWIFVAAAIVAGVIGAAIVVSRKRRNAEAAQPLQKKKKKSTKAAFIEVATVKSSYQAPQEVTTV